MLSPRPPLRSSLPGSTEVRQDGISSDRQVLRAGQPDIIGHHADTLEALHPSLLGSHSVMEAIEGDGICLAPR